MAEADVFAPERFLRGKATPDVAVPSGIPALNDPYKASLLLTFEVSRIVIIMGKNGFKLGDVAYYAFQYVHIGLGEFGYTANGQFFRYVFSDLQPKLVTVEGRNLLDTFDGMALRRVPWIRLADRDFRGMDDGLEDEPVITSLLVEDWQPPRKRRENPEKAEAVTA